MKTEKHSACCLSWALQKSACLRFEMKRRRRLDDSFVQICTNIFKSVFSYEDTVLLIVYIVY